MQMCCVAPSTNSAGGTCCLCSISPSADRQRTALRCTVLCCLQVSVLEEISRGEVLVAVARRCLKLMQDFVGAQKVLADPIAAAAAAASGDPAAAAAGAGVPKPQDLGFEMVCALVNNSVDCYNQSVEFTEHVQVRAWVLLCAATECICKLDSTARSPGCGCALFKSDSVAICNLPACPAGVQGLLDEGFRTELDVEEVCRAFLDLAKAWSRRLIEMMYTDAGRLDRQRATQHQPCQAVWLLRTECGMKSVPPVISAQSCTQVSLHHSQCMDGLLQAWHTWPTQLSCCVSIRPCVVLQQKHQRKRQVEHHASNFPSVLPQAWWSSGARCTAAASG